MTPEQYEAAIAAASQAESDAYWEHEEAEIRASQVRAEYERAFPVHGPKTEHQHLWDEMMRAMYEPIVKQMLAPPVARRFVMGASEGHTVTFPVVGR